MIFKMGLTHLGSEASIYLSVLNLSEDELNRMVYRNTFILRYIQELAIHVLRVHTSIRLN